jgi:hypothetical protein
VGAVTNVIAKDDRDPVEDYRLGVAGNIAATVILVGLLIAGWLTGRSAYFVLTSTGAAVVFLWTSWYWYCRALRAEQELARNISAAAAQREQARARYWTAKSLTSGNERTKEDGLGSRI